MNNIIIEPAIAKTRKIKLQYEKKNGVVCQKLIGTQVYRNNKWIWSASPGEKYKNLVQ